MVVQRNVHSSTVDGLVLSGLRPTFVAPELDPELGIAHCLTPESLDRALAATPGAAGAIVVSPTYFGAVADVRGLSDVAHEHGVPLVVDEAWGAHLAFHERCRSTRSRRARTSSCRARTRSSAASPSRRCCTSGARRGRLDEHVVDRAVTLVESTSPSSLLLGLARRGPQLRRHERPRAAAETIRALRSARQAIRELPGPRRARRAPRRPAGRPRLRPAAPRRRRARHRGDAATRSPS